MIDPSALARLNSTARFLVIFLAFSLIVLALNRPDPSLPVQGQVVAVYAGDRSLGAAAALTNGKPTLFYLFSETHCRQRYCLSSEAVSNRLEQDFGDEVNFVPLRLLTRSTGELLPIQNWDLYPVAPYGRWLNTLVSAEEQTGLAQVLLVGADGRTLYHGDEFFSWEDLGKFIER